MRVVSSVGVCMYMDVLLYMFLAYVGAVMPIVCVTSLVVCAYVWCTYRVRWVYISCTLAYISCTLGELISTILRQLMS